MNLWQDVFNTNFFGGLATILTIGSAIALYLWEKRQSKQQIARLLINEIRNAENAIQVIKERPFEIEFPVIPVLPQNSWNKYSHLFAKDFDQDDMGLINNFYNVTQEIEHIVQKGNKIDRFLLQVTQRSEAIQNAIMSILVNSKDEKDAETKISNFTKILEVGKYHYAPKGFKSDFDELLKSYRPIMGSSAGMLLKKIAGLKI